MESTMTVRCLPLFTVALLGTVHASAQPYTGEVPLLVQPFTELPAFRPANLGGLFLIEGMAAMPEAGGTWYLVVGGRQTPAGLPRLRAWRWNPTTSTLAPLTDVDTFTLDRDTQVSLSPDLLHLVVFGPNGIELGSRATASSPFGSRRAITGLLPNSYAPALGIVEQGLVPVLKLFACTPSPNSELSSYDLDAGQARATNRISLLRNTVVGNRYELVVPLHARGRAEELLVAEGQNLGTLQRWGFTPSFDQRLRGVRWGWDTPTNSKATCAAHRGGGRFLASMFPPRTMEFATVVTPDQRLAAAGGQATFSLLAPSGTNTIGVLLLGMPGSQPIPLSALGIRGNLGLAPDPLLALAAQLAPDGVGTVAVSHGPLAPGSFAMQWVWSEGQVRFVSNTARVFVQ
jgi:hypothetical protein